MSKSTTPKWDELSAIRRGREANHLVETYPSSVEPRLVPGMLEELQTDLATLSVSDPDRRATKTRQKGRTGQERVIARNGHSWVMGIREMAKRTAGITEGELKLVGVGESTHPGSTTQVVAGMNACLQAFAEHAAFASKIGVLDADVAEGKAIVADLIAADGNQTEVMTESKDKTFDRNAVQLRVEAAVDMISSRGAMAFRSVPDIKRRFSDLISSSGPVVSDGDDLSTADEG